VYLLARAALGLLGAGLGYLLANIFVEQGWLTGPINIVYLTILGLLVGYLVSAPMAHQWEATWRRLLVRMKRIPPDAILAAGVGVTVALIITVLLNSLLEKIPGFTWYFSLLITLLLVTASSWFFVANRKLFLNRPSSLPVTGSDNQAQGGLGAKVLDTSAIIDGRVLDVIDANFLEGKILIPRFVLSELQRIADSDDPLRRKRGRRGLEMLDHLVGQQRLPIEIIDDDYADTKEVDPKLIRICQKRHAALITTDYNLNRVAGLQGVRILNINQLANSVKAMFLPGERLSLHIVKAGREPGQGLAYLEDGTMIVVEDTAHLVGTTVDAVVTSNLQTNMGRMIFARLSDEPHLQNQR
jgi:uncharacterized protein YacL